LLELSEPFDLLLRELEPNTALGDPGNLLGGDVAGLAEQAGRDRQAVEDVVAGVSGDLVDRADLLAVRVEHDPAGLDHEPGNRIPGHTARPPTSQTGPWVPTGYVSERARRISTSPVIPRSSQRSKQRAAISGETP